VELFAVEDWNFVVFLPPSYFDKVGECEVLKGGDVPWCEDTPGDRGLCTSIVGWREG